MEARKRWVVEKRYDIQEHFNTWYRKRGIWKPYHVTTYDIHKLHPPRNYYLLGIYDTIEDTRIAIENDLREFVATIDLPKNSLTISLGTRFRIFKRDRYSCQICGKTASEGVKLEIDHKVPRAKGGGNNESNLWTLCFQCNRGKGVKSL